MFCSFPHYHLREDINVCVLLCQIRRKMREIIVREAQSCDLKELVAKFILEVIGKEK